MAKDLLAPLHKRFEYRVGVSLPSWAGMVREHDASSLEPNEFVMLQNTRFIGSDLRSRYGQAKVNSAAAMASKIDLVNGSEDGGDPDFSILIYSGSGQSTSPPTFPPTNPLNPAYLYPNSEAYNNGLFNCVIGGVTYGTGSNKHWEATDDLVGNCDGDSTFAYGQSSTGDATIRFGMTDMVEAATITKIELHYFIKAPYWGFVDLPAPTWASSLQPFLYIGTTAYNGTLRSFYPVASRDEYNYWIEYTDTWTTNPATSTAWTKAVLDAIQVGFTQNQNALFFLSLSSVYIRIFYG
jgi:hypothetical protein